ncbi:MAG: HAD-IA family hydrolase [Alphaproteobacteria bacterium]|nr:HAD-IA family hydrolase [Alphaproteobacteria bacterium]
MVKYCIWDVGKTIYPYSLDPLNEYCIKHSKNPEALAQKGGVKAFDFDPYMKGKINFRKFCNDLCKFCQLKVTPTTYININKEMHRGVGQVFPETKEAMEFLQSRGITNCILSNALPNLAGTGIVEGLVEEKNAFTSYDLRLLKPDPKIFKAVLEKLGAKPGDVIFVDDKLKNVEAAQKLGIHGIKYNRETIVKNIHSITDALKPRSAEKSKTK